MRPKKATSISQCTLRSFHSLALALGTWLWVPPVQRLVKGFGSANGGLCADDEFSLIVSIA